MRTKDRGRSIPLLLIAMLGLTLAMSLHCDDEKCKGGCSDAETEADTGITDGPCEENTARCEGDMVVLCRGGLWQAWEDCAAIKGECKSNETNAYCEVIPVEDTSTDTDSDSATETQDTGA